MLRTCCLSVGNTEPEALFIICMCGTLNMDRPGVVDDAPAEVTALSVCKLICWIPEVLLIGVICAPGLGTRVVTEVLGFTTTLVYFGICRDIRLVQGFIVFRLVSLLNPTLPLVELLTSSEILPSLSANNMGMSMILDISTLLAVGVLVLADVLVAGPIGIICFAGAFKCKVVPPATFLTTVYLVWLPTAVANCVVCPLVSGLVVTLELNVKPESASLLESVIID
uniref:Uncharacterized protein n=1 Tax=Glossina brevipalpis TaxID=37001 RepID=A0A1A9X3C4_9MUSC